RPDPKVLAVLIDGLSHRQPRSRRQAAEGLAAMPSQPTAVPALTALLERRDALDSLEQWRAWQAAAGALGKAGPAGAAAVAALAALIELDAGPVGDERRWARQSAAAALGQIGPAAAQAIPALIRQLDDPDLRAQCPTALGKIGPGALEPLLDTLRNGPASRKGGALDALHAMGPHAAPAVPLLLEMLRSRSGDTMGIALALGSIGPPARVAIPALVRALAWVSPPGSKGFEDKVTFVIERVIDQLGPAEPAGVPELIAALGDANAQVRRWAAIELGRIGPHARAAVAPLERLAAQSDAPASTTFLGALVRIDPSPSRLAPLVALLSAKDAMTRCLAVMQLGSLGPAAAAALPALRQAAQSHDSGLRAFADAAIKNISAATRPASTSSMP
ncbi:MAG: hypothetical protein NT031_14475, partial [Planctomycetota bacterium]|nr:hypothetical protein [Planctomycetota bacterium]